MSFPKDIHDSWKTNPPPNWYERDGGKSDPLEDISMLKSLAEDIHEDYESDLIDLEFVKKINELKKRSTKILENMANDVCYRELFEEPLE